MKGRAWQHLAVAVLGGALAFCAAPAVSFAADGNVLDSVSSESHASYSNTDYTLWHQSGTCVWNIVDGVLTVKPVDGQSSGTLGDSDTFWCAPVYGDREQIRSVKFEPGVKAITCNKMFQACVNLEHIDFSDFDTSAVTDMSYMFDGCNKLRNLNISKLATSSVMNMSHMFGGCLELDFSGLSQLDTSHVTDMEYMLCSCKLLRASDAYGIDTSSVNWFSGMFADCDFASIDLSQFDFSNAVDMSNMLMDCAYLRSVNLSGVKYKTTSDSQFVDYGGMFLGSTLLDQITVDSKTDGISFPCFWNYMFNVTKEEWRFKGRWIDEAGIAYNPNDTIPSKSAVYHAQFDINSGMFNLDMSDEPYTGSPVVKNISSSYFGPIDYSVNYSNNVKPGTATMTISGTSTGRIKGSLSFTFAITGEGAWIHSASGWWWRNPDGSYPASDWMLIDGQWYWFNASGYMVTGWQKIGDTWYYFDGSGARTAGWRFIGGSWYLFADDGSMLTGWQQVGGSWYYFSGSGAMATGWFKIGGAWYYLSGSGSMATGWLYLNGAWYYLNDSGVMQNGWQSIGGKWYFFNSSGCMVTGWFSTGGSWYYSSSSGEMQSSKWVGNYYLTASGAMATNTWIDGYYVGPDGAWIPGYGQSSSGGSSRWDGVTAYWTPNGEKWHKSRNCPSLSKSTNVIQGTVNQVGKRQLCKNCG